MSAFRTSYHRDRSKDTKIHFIPMENFSPKSENFASSTLTNFSLILASCKGVCIGVSAHDRNTCQVNMQECPVHGSEDNHLASYLVIFMKLQSLFLRAIPPNG